MNEYFLKIEAGLVGELHCELEELWNRAEKAVESPIELALATALLFSDRITPTPFKPLIFCRQEDMDHYAEDDRLLVPQYQVDKKRIDFLFRDPPIQIFIECDGHDFHERTKEQAARDRQRDRQLQQTGRHVLRFTGSEIYADPVMCAAQVFDFVSDQHMHDYLRRTA